MAGTLVIIQPITIFMLNSTYFETGIILLLTRLIIVLIHLFVGHSIDKIAINHIG